MSQNQQPTISYITPDEVKDIGGSVEFLCSAQYASDYSILWIKLDKEVPSQSTTIAVAGQLLIKDSRFAIRHDRASTTYTLQVRMGRPARLNFSCTEMSRSLFMKLRISPLLMKSFCISLKF